MLKKVKKAIKHWLLPHGFFILKNRIGMSEALKQLIFRNYTCKRAHINRLKKLSKIREQAVVTVVFENYSLAKWKIDTLYQLMQKHPKFNPIIWLRSPQNTSPELTDKQKALEYFKKNKYNVLDVNSYEEMRASASPDILFLQEPYDTDIDLKKGDLICNIRYSLNNSIEPDAINNFLQNIALYNFVEDNNTANEYKRCMLNHGINVEATGHPYIENLLEGLDSADSRYARNIQQHKKIIWAPHWSVTEGSSYYNTSTFLQISDYMIELAKKYEDKIQFYFKPHPSLYKALCNHPEWGKNKTDLYYNKWKTMPNCQVYTGDYKELFYESDAMIHDCGSFLIEYPLTDKPCLFLLKEGHMYENYNALSIRAMKCHTIGSSINDIEIFILQILNGEDNKQKERESLRLSLQPYISSSQNIINQLLNSKLSY